MGTGKTGDLSRVLPLSPPPTLPLPPPPHPTDMQAPWSVTRGWCVFLLHTPHRLGVKKCLYMPVNSRLQHTAAFVQLLLGRGLRSHESTFFPSRVALSGNVAQKEVLTWWERQHTAVPFLNLDSV